MHSTKADPLALAALWPGFWAAFWAAALFAGCAGPPELTGAAAARSRGAGVDPGDAGDALPSPAPAASAGGEARPQDQRTDEARILARVNGQVVTLRQVRQAIGPDYESLMGDDEGFAALVEAKVRELVVRRLVIDEGKRLKFPVRDEYVEREEERQEKEAERRNSTIARHINDFGMTRREWDQNLREDILFQMTQYSLAAFAPSNSYSEDVFRPCVEAYVSPVDVRDWGGRNPAFIDVRESVVLRVLCTSAADFFGEGGPAPGPV